jgi:Domain of unknown function (DUF4160)
MDGRYIRGRPLSLSPPQSRSTAHLLRDDSERRRPPGSSVLDRAERQDGRMPTISRFFGITVAMYFDDHGHPHFHAKHADGNAKIRIDEVGVIDSNLPERQLRLVLAWAELHQRELLENWRLARAGETLREIDPLQ